MPSAAKLPRWLWPVLIALAPLIVRLIVELMKFPLGSAEPIGVNDPDSWLRLTLVRAWLSGGHWYEHFYLANAPFPGPVSPWTRPLDLVIGLFTTLQPGDASLTLKLLRSALILPILWMGLLTAGLVYASRAVTQLSKAPVLIALLLLSSPVIYNYFGIGNADHHAPLAALFVWVIALLLREKSSVLIGALLALMLWISPEALLPLGMVYAWLGLCWIAGDSPHKLAWVTSSTALFAIAAVMIERPSVLWFVFIPDTISAMHLLPLLLVAVGVWLLLLMDPRGARERLIFGLLVAATTAAVVLKLDPMFFAGPMAKVHPYIKSNFLPRISEARHLFASPPLQVLGMLVQPLLAIWILVRCIRRPKPIIAPRVASALLFFILLSLGLYLLQIRWYYYLYPLVALSLAPWLAAWIRPRLKLRHLPLLLVLLTVQTVLSVAAVPATSSAQKERSACRQDTRKLVQSGLLDAGEHGRKLNLLVPTDSGGEVLFFTRHRIVASNYHREGEGIHDAWRIQTTASLADVKATLAWRRVDVVLICPDRDAKPNAVFRQLYEGSLQLPWLTPFYYDLTRVSEHHPVIFLVKP